MALWAKASLCVKSSLSEQSLPRTPSRLKTSALSAFSAVNNLCNLWLLFCAFLWLKNPRNQRNPRLINHLFTLGNELRQVVLNLGNFYFEIVSPVPECRRQGNFDTCPEQSRRISISDFRLPDATLGYDLCNTQYAIRDTRQLPSVLCRLSSVFCPLSSVLCRLPSTTVEMSLQIKPLLCKTNPIFWKVK